jgi:hypothetical protein
MLEGMPKWVPRPNGGFEEARKFLIFRSINRAMTFSNIRRYYP